MREKDGKKGLTFGDVHADLFRRISESNEMKFKEAIATSKVAIFLIWLTELFIECSKSFLYHIETSLGFFVCGNSFAIREREL